MKSARIVLKRMLHIPNRLLLDIRALFFVTRKRTVKNRAIRVCFIVQMPEIWDKVESVFEGMLSDNRFEVTLLVVPSYDFRKDRLAEYGSERNFFREKYQFCKILYCKKNGTEFYFDGKIGDYDYVFYQRPYVHYLPKDLNPYNVVKYTRICYIPYAYWPFEDCSLGVNWEFFRNVSIAFVEDNQIQKFIMNKYKLTFGIGIQKCVSVGYPVLENMQLSKRKECEKIRILWAPRWSMDSSVGGSHFLQYKDKMINLVSMYNLELIIRPHPMLFDYFIKEKKMTQGEVDDYLTKLKLHNIYIDERKEIAVTFSEVDVLISDISSIIIEFYLTGKPIIFCPPEDIEICSTYKEMLKGMYVAHNWKHITKCIDRIIAGDNLYFDREKVIKKIIYKNENVHKKIIDILVQEAVKEI